MRWSIASIPIVRQRPAMLLLTGAGAPYLGYADGSHAAPITCVGFGDVHTQQMAVDDLNEWDALLKGASEAVGGIAGGGALAARGCISFDAVTLTYTVTIAWQGLSQTVVPTVACGNNTYGSERIRRVVSTTFRPATLL